MIGMGRLVRMVGLAATALICACAPEPAVLPPAPVPAGAAIAVRVEAVPLNPERYVLAVIEANVAETPPHNQRGSQ